MPVFAAFCDFEVLINANQRRPVGENMLNRRPVALYFLRL